MKMTERQYLKQCDDNEAEFNKQYESDMERLDNYINDAYEHIEIAITELWNKRDMFSSCMERKDFDALIVEKFKELL